MIGNVIQHVRGFFAVCAGPPLMDLDTSTLLHFASKAIFYWWYTGTVGRTSILVTGTLCFLTFLTFLTLPLKPYFTGGTLIQLDAPAF